MRYTDHDDPGVAVQPENNYHAMPAARPRAVSLRTAAVISVAGLGANIFLSVMDTVVTPWAAASVAGEVLDAKLVVAAALAFLGFGARIATAAAFITWLFLARRNLNTWRIQGLDLGPGWAIGGWFVPILGLFIPYQLVQMVWRGTRTPVNEIDPPTARPALIRFWWITFLLTTFGELVINIVGLDATMSHASFAIFNAIVTIPTIIAAILAIVIVRRITEGQQRRQAALDQHWESALVPTPGVLRVDAPQAWPSATP